MRPALAFLVGLAVAVPAFALALPGVLPSAPVVAAGPAGVAAYASGAAPVAAHASGHAAGAHDGHASGGHEAGAAPVGHSHARERTAWPPAEGEIPASTEGLVEVWSLTIDGAPDLQELDDLGVDLVGSGTYEDPYVLEGLWVRGELELKDTDDFYVVRGNVVDGTLRLNWNDDRVHVHHNAVRDLRVNENVERTGEATGGLVELNRFGVVGQIRHYDGVFRDNEVGPIPTGLFDDVIEDSGVAMPFFAEPRALNIDGFDGAVFEGNTIFGYVEMQLHGHHHASCFACHSHDHAEGASGHDHTVRFHEADFVGNAIRVDEGVAFRYTDAGHRGDDRTANSEPNEDLELPHVHYTRLAIADNVVEGGPMIVDILNADSRDHANEETEDVEPVAVFDGHAWRADLLVARNRVDWTLPSKPFTVPWFEEAIRDGLLLRDVKEASVAMRDNIVTLSGASDERSATADFPDVVGVFREEAPAALHLAGARAAAIRVGGNTLEGGAYGILVERLAEDAAWTDEGNSAEGAEADVRDA